MLRNLRTATLVGDIGCDGEAKQPQPAIIIANLRHSPVRIPIIVPDVLQSFKFVSIFTHCATG